MGEEERAGARVVKLMTVVALNCLDGGAKLGGHKSKEVRKRRKDIRFQLQRKRP
jgi:hypothetical protein